MKIDNAYSIGLLPSFHFFEKVSANVGWVIPIRLIPASDKTMTMGNKKTELFISLENEAVNHQTMTFIQNM